jgi:hypothetical protein
MMSSIVGVRFSSHNNRVFDIDGENGRLRLMDLHAPDKRCLHRSKRNRHPAVQLQLPASRDTSIDYQGSRSVLISLAAPNAFVMRFRFQAIVAMPILDRRPVSPRMKRQGCQNLGYLIVANGYSTVHRRNLIASAVTRSSIRIRAASYKWRANSARTTELLI